MATNPSIPAGVDPYKVMRCSVCGNSCRVRCLERHIPDFACHNKDCILHSESVHADTVDGVIYPWKNAPQPDPDFEPAPYGTRKQGRDQGRDRDQDRGWQSPRFKTDSDRDHKPFDKEYSQNPFANTHRQDTFDDKRRTDRFDDDFRDGQDRGRSRKNHRAHADPFGDDPFGDDSFGNDPFNDDFFDRARERMAGLGGDPFADKSLMSFGGAPPRSRRPTRDNPPGMDSFMAGCFEDIDRMTKDMGKRFGMTSLGQPACPVANPACPVSTPACPVSTPACPVSNPACPIPIPARPFAGLDPGHWSQGRPGTYRDRPACPVANPAHPVSIPACPVSIPIRPFSGLDPGYWSKGRPEARTKHREGRPLHQRTYRSRPTFPVSTPTQPYGGVGPGHWSQRRPEARTTHREGRPLHQRAYRGAPCSIPIPTSCSISNSPSCPPSTPTPCSVSTPNSCFAQPWSQRRPAGGPGQRGQANPVRVHLH
ncbi:hypothetical protein C8A00DRAFT_36423 [Chaetomidium leptoderma]|uniref:Uncharacterized protein n=1 Tax=Chaetomidium leptoderma TaxID=669021 RepID=A0AAN6VGA5_9PEZI|nr:hypothetical protein C8A00DRAFT_36423 [Chaetomidium leptoderma]